MKISDVSKGTIVLYRRHSAGYVQKLETSKIGVVHSDELSQAKRSDKAELVQVNFGTQEKPQIELIRYNRLQIVEEAVAV